MQMLEPQCYNITCTQNIAVQFSMSIMNTQLSFIGLHKLILRKCLVNLQMLPRKQLASLSSQSSLLLMQLVQNMRGSVVQNPNATATQPCLVVTLKQTCVRSVNLLIWNAPVMWL